MPTLAKVLEDQDPEVRELALELLCDTEGPIPLDAIPKVVRQDPLPEHRLEAIGVLATHDPVKIESLLEEALQDNDPEVADLAKSILEDTEFYRDSEPWQY